MKRTHTDTPATPICWQREAASPCLRVELLSGEIHIFPYSHFVSAHFARSANADSLRLNFSTHEVCIGGHELRDLLLGIQDFAIKWLRAVPERYADVAPTTEGVITAIRVAETE
jgi:hypothetical protein